MRLALSVFCVFAIGILSAGLVEAQEVATDSDTNPDLAKIAEHLSFFGYSVEESEDVVLATSEDWHNLFIQAFPNGILFTSVYTNDSDFPIQREGVFEVLNSINSDAGLTRSYLTDDDEFLMEIIWTGAYDREQFSIFLRTGTDEMTNNLTAYWEWVLEHPGAVPETD